MTHGLALLPLAGLRRRPGPRGRGSRRRGLRRQLRTRRPRCSTASPSTSRRTCPRAHTLELMSRMPRLRVRADPHRGRRQRLAAPARRRDALQRRRRARRQHVGARGRADPRAACAASTSSPARSPRGSGATPVTTPSPTSACSSSAPVTWARRSTRRLEPFEVDVVRVGRTARTLDDGTVVHGTDELPALLPDADVVVLIVPQTPETTGSGRRRLPRPDEARARCSSTSPEARSCVTDDLVDAVRRATCAPPSTSPTPSRCRADHPLWSLPGVLISPHVGGFTTAFLPRAHRLVAHQLRLWRLGDPLDNCAATLPTRDPSGPDRRETRARLAVLVGSAVSNRDA